MSLGHAKLISDSLLSPAKFAKFKHLRHLLVRELGSPVLLIRKPSTTATLIAISNVVSVRSILKMLRVHTLPVIALVATNLRPVSIPQEEGEPMSEYPLLLPAQLAIACLVQAARPLPAAIVGDGRPGFDVALRQRLNVHRASLPYFNG